MQQWCSLFVEGGGLGALVVELAGCFVFVNVCCVVWWCRRGFGVLWWYKVARIWCVGLGHWSGLAGWLAG